MNVRQVYKEFSNGEFNLYWVGKDIGGGVVVNSIRYHSAMGEGDAHYVDIEFSDGTRTRLFRPDTVDFYAK